MYSIYADDLCIYNDAFVLDGQQVISPKLTLSDSAAGSLTMTLPTSNAGYSTIVRMVTDISVRKDDEEIWAGRVLSEQMDFYNNRVLTCEGELAFLNDTIQPPGEFHNMTVQGFLEHLISVHNAKVSSNRQFTVGAVTVHDSNDSIYRYTNYETTIKCINEKLLDKLGGHIRVRKENGVRYIDYLADYPKVNSQKIEFGKNLLDFTKEWDLSEFATVLVPLGKRLDESDIEALNAYTTVASVNNDSIYVVSQDAVNNYGWIEAVVNWDDVETPSALLTKAKEYLADIQFDDMDIELSALDLHYLNVDYEGVELLDQIEVVSEPHGMDRYFPVRKLEIPLDSPEDTTFTLGDTVKATYTSANSKANSELAQKIADIPLTDEDAILDEAKANATAIMNQAVNGYVTITQDEYGTNTFYLSDNRDYTKAQRLWKWNLNGLAYSNDYGKTYGLAMTMDGAIVADYITTGTLRGINITGNTITGGTINGTEIIGGTIKGTTINMTQYSGEINFSSSWGGMHMEDGQITFYDYDSGDKTIAGWISTGLGSIDDKEIGITIASSGYIQLSGYVYTSRYGYMGYGKTGYIKVLTDIDIDWDDEYAQWWYKTLTFCNGMLIGPSIDS